MDNICEEAVLEYLTHEGKIFVCPQFGLEGYKKYYPDFVALNFEVNPPQLEIIEVNGGAYPRALWDLAKKVTKYREDEKQIMNFLNNRLSELKGLDLTGNTPLLIRVFIQRGKVAEFRKHLNGLQNVQINSLDTVFEALLDWHNRTLASEG